MNRKSYLIALWSTYRFILMGIGALLILNISLFSILFWGVSPKLSHTEAELSSLQQQKRYGVTTSPEKAYEQGLKDLKLFRTLLPSMRDFSQLIGDLYALANQSNLEISQISYAQKEIPQSDILTSALKFSLTGTYDELKRFVYGLEISPRLFTIDQMTLTSSIVEGEGVVTLNLSLTTYFRSEAAE